MPPRDVGRPRKKVRKRTPPPKSEAAAGSGYGLQKAKRFKKTTSYKQSVGAAKPRRVTDVSSTQGYDTKRAVQFRRGARKAIHQATRGKPFDAYHARGAITLGYTGYKGRKIKEGINDTFFVHKRRKFLNDVDIPVQPKVGGEVNKYDKKTQAALAHNTMETGLHSAGLKILETAAVPSHGIAGVASGKGFVKGVKEKENFGKIFERKGIPGAHALGFVADVATDPTTYVSFGAGSVLRKGAEKAATDAAKGVTVKFAGKQVPGVTPATASAGGAVKAVAAKSPRRVKRAASTSRDLVRTVRPSLKPAGADSAQFKASRQAARKARAKTTQGVNRAQREARGIKKRVGEKNYGRVIHAVETDTIHELPQELRAPAQHLQTRYAEAKAQRKAAGVDEGTITHYFPHAQEEPLHRGLGITTEHSAQGRTIRPPDSSRERTLKMPLAEANPVLEAEGRGKFSTNVPLVHVNYMSQTARKEAEAELLRGLAGAGREIKPGKTGLHLADHEQVYRLGREGDRYGLHPVEDDELTKLVYEAKGKEGKYVILDRRVEEAARKTARPKQATEPALRVVDRATGGFKRVATATPGFHARNLVGDAEMHYLSVPAHKSPGLIKDAGRTLKQVHREEDAQAAFRPLEATDKTVKVAGKSMPVAQFAQEAAEDGVLRSGRIGREFQDLASGTAVDEGIKRVKKGAGGKLHKVRRVYREDREDLFRVATYKHFRDKGLSRGEAADKALEAHIDYGDLTEAERQFFRRVVPFYTFTARALPYHAKALVQRPGKFANIEKAREEIAGATGVDLDKVQPDLPEYQQRDVGVIAKIKGKDYTIGDALPLTLLNELPVDQVKQVLSGHGPAVGKYFAELGQFTMGLLSPYVKTPFEVQAGKDLFFRKDIEDPNAPLVAAPSWVQHIPKKYWDDLMITPNYVDQSGKKVWGWRGGADYAIKRFPGPFNVANQLTSAGANRAGQDTSKKVLAAVAGVKVRPVLTAQAQLTELYKTRAKLEKRRNALNQQGVSKKSKTDTAEYRKISDEIKAVNKLIYRAAKESGRKLPSTGGPKKVRRSRPSLGGGLGGGVGGSGLGGGLDG